MEINSNASANKVHTKRFQLDNGELIKTSFWVSQIFMIIATIVGVYLAAQEGLSQAITFDNLTNKQNNYYLRQALYDEVNDNVVIINEYADFISSNAPYDIKSHHPVMSNFVWENMRYSPYTLETPPALLSEIRRFYMQSADIIDKIEGRIYGVKYGAGLLKELTQEVSDKTLPALKANYSALAVELKRNDIFVD
ncbi:hypothetical protein [Shewanella psychrotolerans]|uniref:hypothetical protein n=1 Tax=Shewanella psychrotolerans TaxID=2864206 RepID=UPI001C658025|nr:hypothetical protein [Shewanella psychrotolerans]QYK02048.1 hypothetical protein K0I62_03465 [Shewanella psychrotolerans]